MLKVLLKKQLAEIFRGYFYNAKKNKARSRGAVIANMLLFAALMVVLLGGIFTFLSFSLCGALSAAGMDWMYFALMGLLAVFLGVFGSVFNTYSGLYLAKDNDLLLSMPIAVNVIMISRLLSVYLMGLMYSGVVILPAVIVYWITVSSGAGAILGGLLLVLLISVLVMTLSCALGWVVAKISLKLKNKSFITVLVSLVFFGAYYFFYFKAQSVISDLVANAAVYGAQIRSSAYPLYLFGRVGTGDPAAMAIVTAVTAALFALMWVLISRSFLRLAVSTGAIERRVYRTAAVKSRSIHAALLSKEFARFTSSPNYMLNCGFGILLLPIGGAALLWKGGSVLAVLGNVFDTKPGCVAVLLCAMICMLASMNDMAAPSVSLEGKSLWLLQSLPVTPWQALRAKLAMQLLLTGIPLLVCVLCVLLAYPCGAVEAIFLLLLPLCYTLFSALLALTMGLKMPNLTWTSELIPVKQSACVFIALFGGWVYALLLGGGYLLAGWRLGFAGYMGAFAALTLAFSGWMYVWLKEKGSRAFAAL